MMRSQIFAFIFVTCLCGVLAEDVYVTKYFATPRLPFDSTSNLQQVIKYFLKVPAKFPAHGPVIIGTAGRVPVTDIRNQYQLFDKIIPEFGNAAVAYVEQRYFGDSKMGEESITKVSDLEGLRFTNVLNDYVLLIQELAVQLNTKNFLLFGGGHGGLIAGYVANKFATDPVLIAGGLNVMAWASSPPLKYLRQDTDFNGDELQSLNKRFGTVVTTVGGCDANAIARLPNFWKKLREVTTAKLTGNIANLNLLPALVVNNAAPAGNNLNLLLEFIVFLRNNLRDLAYKNQYFDSNGNPIVDANNDLKKFCDAINLLPDATDANLITVTQIESLLIGFVPGYTAKAAATDAPTFQWRINPTQGNVNRAASLAAFQDCTELQLVSCSKANDPTDPFSNSEWNNNADCSSVTSFDINLQAQCTVLFPNLIPSSYILNKNQYPRSWKKNVVITMNDRSPFYASYPDKFGKDEKDEKNFAWNFYVKGSDNWEFEAPKKCDSPKMNDIRYLTLRAFGCFGKFIDNSGMICDTNLFNDDASNNKKEYDDKPDASKTCPVDDTIKFPFGAVHTPVKFIDPQAPPKTITPTTSTGTSTSTMPSIPKRTTSKAKTPSKGNGSESLVPMMSVFIATFIMCFSAFSLN